MAEQLSPAAQAILNGFLANWQDVFLEQDRVCIAAALEALADHVVPELEEPDWGAIDHIPADIVVFSYHRQKRSRILAIAAELRGEDQPSSDSN